MMINDDWPSNLDTSIILNTVFRQTMTHPSSVYWESSWQGFSIGQASMEGEKPGAGRLPSWDPGMKSRKAITTLVNVNKKPLSMVTWPSKVR